LEEPKINFWVMFVSLVAGQLNKTMMWLLFFVSTASGLMLPLCPYWTMTLFLPRSWSQSSTTILHLGLFGVTF